MRKLINGDGRLAPASVSEPKHLVLAGGGHAHALILKRWAMHPKTRPRGCISLVNKSSGTLYSGLIPAHFSSNASLNAISIDIRSLANRSGVHFIQAEILGLNLLGKSLNLKGRPDISFDLLSLNVGAIAPFQEFQRAIPIKPLERSISAMASEDFLPRRDETPFHVVGSGLAATEVIFALRQRWPRRPLVLHRGGRPLKRTLSNALMRAGIELSDQKPPDDIHTLLCTGAVAPNWIQSSGVSCDAKGRILTNSCLQSLDHPWLFAAGDCADIKEQPRPPSGVYAVRAARPLAVNLERVMKGHPPKRWSPQRNAMQLLGAPSKSAQNSAWAIYGNHVFGPSSLLWVLKNFLDQRFMRQFNTITASMKGMGGDENSAKLTMACRGCAAKLGPKPLREALEAAGLASFGKNPADAHRVAEDQENRTILSSVDGFPALISDPWLNGRLTTLHACSDLWASGADVNNALAILTLPSSHSKDQIHLMSQTLAGIRSALEEQGATLLGGHTMESRQAFQQPIGQDVQVSLSVIGATAPQQAPWGKGPIRAEDQLLLSRPLGTGILFAAAMQGRCPGPWLDGALAQMGESQHLRLRELQAANYLHTSSIHACTDVTGFGLLGHLNEMVEASPDIQVELDSTKIPLFDGVMSLLAEGITSTAAPGNRQAWSSLGSLVVLKVDRSNPDSVSALTMLELLIDPQTCGPLLVSCNPTVAQELINQGWIAIGRAQANTQ